MNAIRATVRNGRIEPDAPLTLPEGAKLLVLPETGVDGAAAQDDVPDDDMVEGDSPEAIARWLAWYRSLEPLILTDEERRAWDEWRAAQKAWELNHFDERMDKLRRMWE